MNLERINDAIRVMENAQNLYMLAFQKSGDNRVENYVDNIDDLHACGNTACFAGYIALSPMFQDAGGKVDDFLGAPAYKGKREEEAIALYLDIPLRLAKCLVYGGFYDSMFYPVPFKDVEPHHVIEKLKQIKRGEVS